jgi:glycosyltransferase involved in cell wall biosynthesis
MVTHVHHWEPVCAPVERWVISKSDLVVVDSHFVAQQLRNEFARVGKDAKLPPVVVSGCGIREPGGKGYYRTLNLAVTVGPLIPRKRPLELVRLWADVVRMRPDSDLIWVGDGPLLAEARALVRTLDIQERVFFLGRTAELLKDALLRTANLFVFMSKMEGCPLAVLEAMAAGLPIVAAEGGPMLDLLGNRQAMPERDMPDAIVRALACQPTTLAVMNRAAWQGAYTPEVWLDRIESAYRSML